MDYQKILEEISEEIQPFLKKGQVADYIPALKNVNPNDFAMSIKLIDGTAFHVGCFEKKFSIQSISKVFTFSQALNIYSTSLYNRVWHEPSGNPFNSLVQLEYEKGIPRNPFINAGAIVTTDTLLSHFKSAHNTFEEINKFINKISKSTITYDEEIIGKANADKFSKVRFQKPNGEYYLYFDSGHEFPVEVDYGEL